MRTMLRIWIPMERGNQAFRDGSITKTVESFMERYKPEAAYFFPDQGRRSAMFIFDLPDPSHIVVAVEQFFLGLDAEVSLTPVMNADDLQSGFGKAAQFSK